MTEQQLLRILGTFGVVFLLALFLWVSDLCFQLGRGPVVLRRVGRFFYGTFRRAMTTYGVFSVMAVAFATFLFLWPYISGSHGTAEMSLVEQLLMLLLIPALFLPLYLRETYKSLSRRFGRGKWADKTRVWEELKIDTISEAIEKVFHQSGPDGTPFRETVHRLLTKYGRMRQGKIRDVYARAFEQLLARDDECGEAFREVYEEWHAGGLQGGD